jgi:hypothetical protein
MERDDFFTQIHKGLRKALFDVTVMAGRTDWDDGASVDALLASWRPLRALLDAHTEHEETFFFALAESKVPGSTAGRADEHLRLDELLHRVGDALETAAASRDQQTGLHAYRALTAFVGAYLPHLLEEETAVMPLLWAQCTDGELAACRGAFLDAMTPDVAVQSREVMLAAMSPGEIAALQARLAAVAGSTSAD